MRDLNVISVGARTSLGVDLASSAAAARAGITAFGDHPFMIDRAGRRMLVARDSTLTIEAEGEERLAQLVAAAAADSLATIPSDTDGRKLPVMLFLALREVDRACSPLEVFRLVQARH